MSNNEPQNYQPDPNLVQEHKNGFFNKVWAWIKEFFRKQIVGFKRTPSRIVIILLILSLIIYTFNMGAISNTTALINGVRMGLYSFITTLLSILVVVAAMNAYPRRKPVRKSMLVVTFVMIAAMLLCNIGYFLLINKALTRAVAPIQVTKERAYITTAQIIVIVHSIFLLISASIIILLPLISKGLRKINTSIVVEEQNINVAELDLTEDESEQKIAKPAINLEFK